MTSIDVLNNNPLQTTTLVLTTGDLVTFDMRFSDNQKGWFYDLVYKDFKINNRRIVMSPNFLRAFRGIIPFGLACVVSDRYEPVFIDDFSSGRAKMYLLDSTDVSTVENEIII